MPKQFLAFGGDRTLLEEALLRVKGPAFRPPLLVANEEHRFLVRDQVGRVRKVEAGSIVLEPFGRNTAAVAVAVSMIAARESHDLVLLLPSDHGECGSLRGRVKPVRFQNRPLPSAGVSGSTPQTPSSGPADGSLRRSA